MGLLTVGGAVLLIGLGMGMAVAMVAGLVAFTELAGERQRVAQEAVARRAPADVLEDYLADRTAPGTTRSRRHTERIRTASRAAPVVLYAYLADRRAAQRRRASVVPGAAVTPKVMPVAVRELVTPAAPQQRSDRPTRLIPLTA